MPWFHYITRFDQKVHHFNYTISHYYYYSGQGETVVSMLTDLNGFLTYENREFSLAEGSEGTFV